MIDEQTRIAKIIAFYYGLPVKEVTKLIMQPANYSSARKTIIELLERDWGPRCETSDVEDFPELEGQTNSRCACCLVYEKFDNFWEYFAHDDADNL